MRVTFNRYARTADSARWSTRTTPEFSAVLVKVGTNFESVRSLPHAEVKRVFSRLGVLYPDCMYTFDLIEKTRYVEPRDAATANWNVRVIPRRG